MLTADRSQMSNYRWNFLWGFLSSGPVKAAPEPIYSLICPTNDTYDPETGEMLAAPLGLRRVQASLEGAYGNGGGVVRAQHPFRIEDAVGEKTEIVALSEMSPLGLGPVDTALSWYNTTWNRFWFGKLTDKLKKLKQKYGFKVLVGGAGSWQLLDFSKDYMLAGGDIDPDKREKYGIDHVVLGECDKAAPEIFEKISNGSAPDVIKVFTNTILEMSEIPEITGPTLTGIVECMRGCGRGCDFCAPNLRKKRDFPPERVAREARVNIARGYDGVWLQTEELTLYGCDNQEKWPNEEAIVELFTVLREAGATLIGATHWTFAGVRAAPELVRRLSEINHMGPSHWMGVQPGLEYASTRLVRKYMPYKVKPYSPEEYPETVREGIKIMNRHYYYPASTLIVGHPGEEPDEVQMTIDLIRQLSEKDKVHGIFAPLLYVDYNRAEQTMNFEKMHDKHWQLYYFCWKHNIREFREKIWLATQNFGPVEKLISALGTYVIGWHLLGFLKHQFKKRFGFVPNWMD